MKDISINLLKLFLVWTISVFLVESCGRSAYTNGVHPQGELALTGYQDNRGVQSSRAFFLRNISMRSQVMAELERNTFKCTGFLCHQSVKPFKLCYQFLTVIGKTSIKNIGMH